MKQLPILPPATYARPCPWHPARDLATWLRPRVLELAYTAWDLAPFARDHGWDGPPFRWDEDRRFLLRCELDAAFFHLYLGTPAEWRNTGSPALLDAFPTPRDAVDHILETFPVVKRKDVAEHGEYRTKLRILDIYDAMQRAIDTGEPYRTPLDPPPAHSSLCHPERTRPGHLRDADSRVDGK